MKPNPLKGGFSVLSDLFPHSLSPPLYFNYLFFSHTLSSLSLPLSFSSPVGSGLVVCRLENAPLATEKESRLLFFPEMEDGFDIDNLSCHDRLSKAQLSSECVSVTVTCIVVCIHVLLACSKHAFINKRHLGKLHKYHHLQDKF